MHIDWIVLILIPAVYAITINPELCSADNMYCYDEKTESIVKVGANSFSSPHESSFSPPTGFINSPGHLGKSTGNKHTGPSCKVVGYTEVTPGIPGVAKEVVKTKGEPTISTITESPPAVIPIPVQPVQPVQPEYFISKDNSNPSTTYEHDPRKYIAAHINVLSNSRPERYLYPQPPPMNIQMQVPPAYIPPPVPQVLPPSYSIPFPVQQPPPEMVSPLQSPSKMYVTNKKICFERPKQQYLSVRCCKTTLHPVSLPKVKPVEPCVCPDGFSIGRRYANIDDKTEDRVSGTWLRSDLEHLRSIQRLL